VPQADRTAGQRRSFASAVVETFSANVVVSALSLVNVVVTARALGPAGRGEVAFLTTMAGITSQLAALGVQQANVNLAGGRPKLVPALLANSLALACLLGAAASSIVAGAVALVPAVGGGVATPLLAFVLATLPVLILRLYLEYLAYADYRFRLANVSWMLISLVTCTVNGTLAVLDVLSVAVAVGSWVGGQALAAALLWWQLGGFRRRPRDFDGALARQALGFGLRAHGGRVMLLGNYRVDQWILGSVAGQRELGLYSIAVSWAETLFFLPAAMAAVQRPDLVRADAGEAGRRAAFVFRTAAAATIVATLAVLVLAPVLCVGFFGENFVDAVGPLRVLAVGALGIAALKLLGNALTAQNMPLRETAAIGVSFAAILALDIALIPRYGADGAAIASAIAYSLGGVAVALIFVRSLPARLSWLVPRPADALVALAQLAHLVGSLRRRRER
jgi:O-antigen/teichoic acid export membrane protein